MKLDYFFPLSLLITQSTGVKCCYGYNIEFKISISDQNGRMGRIHEHLAKNRSVVIMTFHFSYHQTNIFIAISCSPTISMNQI